MTACTAREYTLPELEVDSLIVLPKDVPDRRTHPYTEGLAIDPQLLNSDRYVTFL